VVTQVTDGVDLAAEIKKSGALGVQRTTSIATQLLKALHELHSTGVPHGNIRAQTILLTQGKGRTDLVKLVDAALPSSTGPRELAGDLKDVGHVLHLMITGQSQPVDARTLESSGVRERPDVMEVVQRFLSPAPDRRPVSALHGLSLLQKLLPAPVEISNADLLALETHEFSILEVEREARLKALAAETTTGGTRVPPKKGPNVAGLMVGTLVVGALLGAGVMYAMTKDRPATVKPRPNAPRR